MHTRREFTERDLPEHRDETMYQNEPSTPDSEAVILKGSQLHERICALSSFMETVVNRQEHLILSFDLYCILLEYSVLLGKFDVAEKLTIDQLIDYDQLIFDTGGKKLMVLVDFFAPANSVTIS